MTLLPTLNRLKLLERFLDSAVACNTTSPGLVIVDGKDWEKNRLKYKALTMPKGWEFFLSVGVKMGDKVREAWSSVMASDAKWVNLLNDDHVIRTKNWDQILAARIDGTNFVTCQDGWMSPTKAAGATMFSVKLLETLGIPIYPPKMKHLFIDDFWETIGRGNGIWDIEHSVLIEHHNQLKTPTERDSTFYEVYGRNQDLTQSELWKHDEQVYRDYVRQEFLPIRDKIRKLRGMTEIVTNA